MIFNKYCNFSKIKVVCFFLSSFPPFFPPHPQDILYLLLDLFYFFCLRIFYVNVKIPTKGCKIDDCILEEEYLNEIWMNADETLLPKR